MSNLSVKSLTIPTGLDNFVTLPILNSLISTQSTWENPTMRMWSYQCFQEVSKLPNKNKLERVGNSSISGNSFKSWTFKKSAMISWLLMKRVWKRGNLTLRAKTLLFQSSKYRWKLNCYVCTSQLKKCTKIS